MTKVQASKRWINPFAVTVLIFSLSLAIFAIAAASPNLPVYEARYWIGLMVLAFAYSVLINQQKNNPFVDILHIVFFVFYLIRAVALLVFPLNSDLLTLQIPAGTISNATIFLILAFISLVVGCHFFLNRMPIEIWPLNSTQVSLVRILIWIIAVSILINTIYYYEAFATCNNVYTGISNSALAILQSIFDSWRSLLILIPIIFLYRGVISNVDRALSLGALILFFLIGIFIGQKSTALQVVLYTLFPAILALRSPDRYQIKIGKLMLYAAIVFSLIVAGYIMGKTMRIIHLNDYGCVTGAINGEKSSTNFGKLLQLGGIDEILQGRGSIEMTSKMNSSSLKESLDLVLPLLEGFSYRSGYYDFFLEKYINPAYSDLITLKQYSMAIIDKVTPGFDVFNVPFISRSIYYAHHQGAIPGTMMNSEQITVFGEAALLFGWGGLIYLPLMCWAIAFLHKALSRQVRDYKLGKIFVYLFTLQIFYYWIEGMGLDMLLVLHLLYTGIYMFGILVIAWGTLWVYRKLF